MRTLRTRILTVLALGLGAAVVGILSDSIIGFFFGSRFQDSATLIYAFGIGATFAVFLGYVYRLLEANPATFKLSILGFPYAGKTVYLTLLFNQLISTKQEDIQFAPYGQETIEQVLRDLNTLSSGIWLPPTQPGTVFYYRANAVIGGQRIPFLTQRFKLEIGDYAGEHIDEFDPSSELWLHKSDYFNDVVNSDGILLALDVDYLISRQITEIGKLQNVFIAAIQVLAEKKGIDVSKKLKTPVALLFLKTDLIFERGITEEMLLDSIPRLLNVCENTFEKFTVFFVSSVGEVSKTGDPPEVIRPLGVVEPLIWMLNLV